MLSLKQHHTVHFFVVQQSSTGTRVQYWHVPSRDAEETDDECGQLNSGGGGPSCRPRRRLQWQQIERWRFPWTWRAHPLKASSFPRRWWRRVALGLPVRATEKTRDGVSVLEFWGLGHFKPLHRCSMPWQEVAGWIHSWHHILILMTARNEHYFRCNVY